MMLTSTATSGGNVVSSSMRTVVMEMENVRVELSRPVFTNVPTRKPKPKPRPIQQMIKRKCETEAKRCFNRRALLSLIPALTWIRQYQWRKDLMPDMLAGLTVGVVSIPQGMAYAQLAGMPPIYGLYTNIIPTIVYFFLGTSKIAAIGPVTVLSLITGSVRFKHIPCQDCWMYGTNSSTALEVENSSTDSSMMNFHTEPVLTPIDIGTSLAFMVGIFLIAMGLLRLSFVSNYLPDQLVNGFSIAAAVQVFAGQLPSIFGMTMPQRNEVGKVVLNIIDLFSSIARTNLASFSIFCLCFVFLILSKHVISPRFQSKLNFPIPGEFIVMVGGTLASHLGGFGRRYGVSTVRQIPAGLPAPRLPKYSLFASIAPDAFLLAVVTYSHSISLARMYAKKHGYRVKSVQEFFAHGFTNLIGSFFQCFNAGQSVARSLVYESVGARSQMCGLLGAFIVVITVLFIAPFLESLPNAVLASIIVAACVQLFRSVGQLPTLYRTSKHDCAIFIVTMVSVVLLDVTYGLAVSVAFAQITVIVRSQRPRVESFDAGARLLFDSEAPTHRLDYITLADQTNRKNSYHDDDRVWCRIIFLRVVAPWFFANAEKVKNELLQRIVTAPALNENNGNNKAPNTSMAAVVILDLSGVTFADSMGIQAMKDVSQKMKELRLALYVCGRTEIVETLVSSSQESTNESDISLFPSVIDAVSYARYRFRYGDEGLAETVFNGTTAAG